MEIFFIWLLCSILGGAILNRYNRAGTGFLLGLFLGPFGLLFAFLIRSGEEKKIEQKRHEEQIQAIKNSTEATSRSDAADHRECPYCAETILAKAKVCKHCHKEVEPLVV